MYTNITGETPIAALTVSQFVELLEKSKTPEPASTNPVDYTQGYAFANYSAYPMPPPNVTKTLS